MERDNERISIPPIGATSLLTVFAVLCLTVFALLALADVRSDARLAQAAQDSVTAYYAADTQAQEILARLRAGELPDGVQLGYVQYRDGSCRNRYIYTVPVSDSLELQVTVEGSEDGGYQVMQWQTVPTQGWTDDQSIKVWSGDE